MVHELVIIGSGPAGLTAGIYAARANLSPLIIDGTMPGGQLMRTSMVENWPAQKSILGPKLMMDMREHATHFGAQFLAESITRADFTKQPFTLETDRKTILQARSVILATGASPNKLGCPGEEQYWGKGVTTCAVCDGAFYKDRKTMVIGGGDTAMEDASFLKKFTKDVIIVQITEKLTASHAMQQRVLNDSDIKIMYESTVSAFEGDGSHVTHAIVENKKTGEKTKIAADGVFLAIGLKPNTAPFAGQVALTPQGYVHVENTTHTSVPGVFTAGDVQDFRYRQAITSAGSGCMAALDAERYLKSL